MTGLERNADVVTMASYAPLFAHAEGWQWTPDLIWVDNLKVVPTTDYYVQKLFSLNKGTKVVSMTANNQAVAGQDSLYASAVIDETTNDLIIKLVNVAGRPQNSTLSFEGVTIPVGEAKLTVLQGPDLNAVNSFDHPQQVAPKESTLPVANQQVSLQAAPFSFTVLRIKLAKG